MKKAITISISVLGLFFAFSTQAYSPFNWGVWNFEDYTLGQIEGQEGWTTAAPTKILIATTTIYSTAGEQEVVFTDYAKLQTNIWLSSSTEGTTGFHFYASGTQATSTVYYQISDITNPSAGNCVITFDPVIENDEWHFLLISWDFSNLASPSTTCRLDGAYNTEFCDTGQLDNCSTTESKIGIISSIEPATYTDMFVFDTFIWGPENLEDQTYSGCYQKDCSGLSWIDGFERLSCSIENIITTLLCPPAGAQTQIDLIIEDISNRFPFSYYNAIKDIYEEDSEMTTSTAGTSTYAQVDLDGADKLGEIGVISTIRTLFSYIISLATIIWAIRYAATEFFT